MDSGSIIGTGLPKNFERFDKEIDRRLLMSSSMEVTSRKNAMNASEKELWRRIQDAKKKTKA
jgi:hypothetical protein